MKLHRDWLLTSRGEAAKEFIKDKREKIQEPRMEEDL